jgi:hypothetical protein
MTKHVTELINQPAKIITTALKKYYVYTICRTKIKATQDTSAISLAISSIQCKFPETKFLSLARHFRDRATYILQAQGNMYHPPSVQHHMHRLKRQ